MAREKKTFEVQKIWNFFSTKNEQCKNFTLDIEAKKTCERNPKTNSGAMRACEMEKNVCKIWKTNETTIFHTTCLTKFANTFQ
jgi:hypothetical protein